jgi:hypothetical protein
LVGFDDGVAWRAPPRLAWPVYGGMLAALAGLALFAGLALVPLGVSMLPSPAVCRVDPDQLALLREQSHEAARTDALKAQLAQLQEQHGERVLECPMPREVVPAPPPSRRADLPEDRWNRHDLSMLEGCWNSYTPLRLETERNHQVLSVRSWQYCFDTQGHGHQTITLDNGDHCEGNLSATFESGGALQMRDLARCKFGFGPLRLGQLRCRRTSDTDAQCGREDLDGPKRGLIQEARFRRAGAPEAQTAGPGMGAK